jgi:hypothetical protein
MHPARSGFLLIRTLALASFLPVLALRASAEDSLLRVKYGEQSLELTAAAFAALPHVQFAAVNGHTKETHRYLGVPVSALLAKTGAPLGIKLRGKAMQMVVRVRAADGYAVVFALTQFDERFTDRTIYLVDSQDGHPLDAKIGPLALVIPGDKAPARWARKIVSMEVQ